MRDKYLLLWPFLPAAELSALLHRSCSLGKSVSQLPSELWYVQWFRLLNASQEHMFTSLLSCLWRPLDASWTFPVSVPADNSKSFVADISRLFEKLLTKESTPEMRASCVNFHFWNYFSFWQVHGPFTVSIGHIVRFFQWYFENRLLMKLVSL